MFPEPRLAKFKLKSILIFREYILEYFFRSTKYLRLVNPYANHTRHSIQGKCNLKSTQIMMYAHTTNELMTDKKSTYIKALIP